MKMSKPIRSISGRIIKIVALSMATLLLFQCFTLAAFLRENERRKKDYVEKTAASIVSSLNTINQNLEGLGQYISNFEAFQNLYIRDRSSAQDQTLSVVSAFNTVRLMAINFPFVMDVMVVSSKGVPFSYLSGMDYGIADIVSQQYDYYDPAYVSSKYIYFKERDYFAYVVPISSIYTVAGTTQKSATCIILCNKKHIADLIEGFAPNNSSGYAIFDSAGSLIASDEGIKTFQEKAYDISVDVPEMSLTVRAYGLSSVDASISMFFYYIISSVLLLISIVIIVIMLLQGQIARPISELVREMSDFGGKSFRKRLDNSQIYEINQLRTGLNNMLDEIESNTRRIFATQEKLYEMEVRKSEAEIYALQSQINPHFLFNTLQCIRSIAIMNHVDEIAQISLSMSELFRYSMSYNEMASVGEEIDIVKHYVLIFDRRFQGRIQFVFRVDSDVLPYAMHRMMLQPLVENSINHGVSKMEEGGIVEISGSLRDNEVILAVSDNGPGFSEIKEKEIMQEFSKGFAETLQSDKTQSFGLYNIDRRLKLKYGETYGVMIQSENRRTVVSIYFPANLPSEKTHN